MVKINTNIFSLLVQRNMAQSSKQLQQSYDRLSSGQRISRAADDPAGLATSERLRYEIGGLRQNQQNVSGAVSLIGTAESYLNSIADLLQRARELAVQAGNDTLQPTDRQAIQNELNQILSEIDRTGATAKFNDQYLLNGAMQNVAIQVGTAATDTLPLTLGDCRIAALGARALLQGATPVAAGALSAGAVSINGVAVPASAGDGVSTSGGAGSALAKATAINQIEAQTGVRARALPTTLAGTAAIQPVALNTTTQRFEINGVPISGITVAAGDDNQALVSAINAKALETGVTAAVDGAGLLTLSAADGRNIQVLTTGGVGGSLGLAAPGGDVAMTQTGRLELSATRTFSFVDATGQLGLGSGTIQVAPNAATALQNLKINRAADAADALATIDTALGQLSDNRAGIGAISNRLSAIGDTLARRIEDLTSSDSAIRDTDFAYESARLTQAQILQDAAVAMLTQANVTPRRALDLLQS